MKVIINMDAATPVVENTYPMLKKGKVSGMIALFFAPKTGMILEGEDTTRACRAHQHPFYVSNTWANEDDNWEVLPNNFSVTLSND